MKTIIHQGNGISTNSYAYELWAAKMWPELEKHLKEIRDKAIKRGEIRPHTITHEVEGIFYVKIADEKEFDEKAYGGGKAYIQNWPALLTTGVPVWKKGDHWLILNEKHVIISADDFFFTADEMKLLEATPYREAAGA